MQLGQNPGFFTLLNRISTKTETENSVVFELSFTTFAIILLFWNIYDFLYLETIPFDLPSIYLS